MLEIQSAAYVGKNYEEGYIGYCVEHNIFLLLSIEEGVTEEEGKKILHKIQTKLLETSLHNLAKFEAKMSEAIVKSNIPAHFSLAAGLFL